MSSLGFLTTQPQKGFYITATEDHNKVFEHTNNHFQQRVNVAAQAGIHPDCQFFSNIYAINEHIQTHYQDGLNRLYFRAHGRQQNGRGTDILLKSDIDGGSISLSTHGEQLETLKKICQAVQPGGVLIVESCFCGLGKDNLLKFLAKLCKPGVVAFGSKGSENDVEFDPILTMHTRFVDAATREDLTRIYYTKSEKVQHIPVDQFTILWDFLCKKIDPNDLKTLEKAYHLCYQLLGERNDPEALDRIKGENKELIDSLLDDPIKVQGDFKKLTFSKADVSHTWQMMLTDLENASELFGHQGQKEFSLTLNSKSILEGDEDKITFTQHSSRYHAAYQFLLGCAAIEKYKTIGILYDNKHPWTIYNPGSMIMHALANQSIHTDELSLTAILSGELPKFKQSYLMAKEYAVEDTAPLNEWLTEVIGKECGSCFNRYIESNMLFYLTQLSLESNLALKIAVEKYQREETLLRHLRNGASLDHTYADGRTIWDVALDAGDPATIALLFSKFPEDRLPFLIDKILKINDLNKTAPILLAVLDLLNDRNKEPLIREILKHELVGLPLETTATNFTDQALLKLWQVIYFKENALDEKANQIWDHLQKSVAAFYMKTYAENIPLCTSFEISHHLYAASNDIDKTLEEIAKDIPDLHFLQDREPSTIHAWLQNPANRHLLIQIDELDLSKKNLKVLPAEIGLFTGLKNLVLADNEFQTLPEQIKYLTQLSYLDLEKNQLRTLPKQIGNLNQLEELYLNHNQLKTLPEQIGSLCQLQVLYLNDNQLETLPEQIGNLNQLQILYLNNNKLQMLPKQIGLLNQLLYLNLDMNLLRKVPRKIWNLNQLRHLYINDNQLETLPEQIGQLNQLLHLGLENNKLNTLPEQIGNLNQLQNLHLNDNQLETLPEQIGNLNQLKHLSINNNKLKKLPEQIAFLKRLSYLSLDNNLLHKVPKQIWNLNELQHLYLNNNLIDTFSEQIGNLNKLLYLGLNNNKLRTVPEQIGHLKELLWLSLEMNLLQNIPEQIGNLHKLEHLHINDNQLKKIPEQIGNLKKLQQLHLNNNQLKKIPEQIGNLKKLQQLYLNDNQLKKIPERIGSLNQLVNLNLSNNQLHTLPEKIRHLNQLLHLNLNNNNLKTLPEQIHDLNNLQTLTFCNNKIDKYPKQIQKLNLKYLSFEGNPFELNVSRKRKLLDAFSYSELPNKKTDSSDLLD